MPFKSHQLGSPRPKFPTEDGDGIYGHSIKLLYLAILESADDLSAVAV